MSRDADMKTIRRVFRELSIQLHPDKVGDNPESLARFFEIREASDALTKHRPAYDKAIENLELNDMAPRCEAFMIMMYFWILHSLIDWVQVEDALIAMKKQLRTYILQDRDLDTTSLGIEPEEKCREVLKQYCETSEEVELPSLQPKQFTTGGREDVERMRELLADYLKKQKMPPLKPFIQVTGMIDQLNQQFVLATNVQAQEVGNISSTDGFYNNYTFTVEGKDIVSGEMKKESSKVVGYIGERRAVTIEKSFAWEPEPGKAKYTLSKDGSSSAVKGIIGYHTYPHLNQVMTLGEGVQDERFQWKLRKEKNFYSGYKIEFRNGDDFVGWQRVHEYFPQEKRVILRVSSCAVHTSVSCLSFIYNHACMHTRTYDTRTYAHTDVCVRARLAHTDVCVRARLCHIIE